MLFFRSTFPTESITPKLHMLENHVGEFISKWKISLGMYAEQGGESIHPEFNESFKRYSCMPSDKDHILCLLREHHMKVRPNAKILVPETVKRNLKNKKEE